MNGEALAKKLSVPGLAFEATTFTPRATVHSGKVCKGIRIKVTDRARFSPIRAGIMIAKALHELHPTEWELDKLDRLLQYRAAVDAIRDAKSVDEIEATWSSDLTTWRAKRDRFLLYR